MSGLWSWCWQLLEQLLSDEELLILKALLEKPNYPLKLARQLNIPRHRVYYHLGKLEKLGLVRVRAERRIRGTRAQIYEAVLPVPHPPSTIEISRVGEAIARILRRRPFSGLIVVGSPEVHGAYKQRARCGHLAGNIAVALGTAGLLDPQNPPQIVLDTEVTEGELASYDLIVIEGPKVNAVCDRINPHLPVRFVSQNGFRVYSEISGREYLEDDVGVVCAVPSPFSVERRLIMLAGLHITGTRAAVLAFTRFADRLLQGVENEERLARVVLGVDVDADGRPDDIEILE